LRGAGEEDDGGVTNGAIGAITGIDYECHLPGFLNNASRAQAEITDGRCTHFRLTVVVGLFDGQIRRVAAMGVRGGAGACRGKEPGEGSGQ
jgi:hypothetical protein